MATTRSHHVGRTRIRLAKMLTEAFPGYEFDPTELHSQIPMYATAQFDCCSWTATGRPPLHRNRVKHVCSWNTMGDCVRKGFAIHPDADNFSAEVSVAS